MKIKIATMTGADDSINPDDLVAIQDQFPFVEWGILVSESQTGNPRFPTHEWINKFLAHTSLERSVHICGQWVRDICKGNWTLPHTVDWADFDRVQLNFHSYSHDVSPEFFELLKANENYFIHYILQLDGVNDSIIQKCDEFGIKNTVPIFDKSGGAGIVPDSWPKPMYAKLCTYAGGLGSDNLSEELKKIESVVGEATIAVDMETKIRSNDDKLFDLDKVVTCLKLIEPYV